MRVGRSVVKAIRESKSERVREREREEGLNIRLRLHSQWRRRQKWERDDHSFPSFQMGIGPCMCVLCNVFVGYSVRSAYRPSFHILLDIGTRRHTCVVDVHAHVQNPYHQQGMLQAGDLAAKRICMNISMTLTGKRENIFFRLKRWYTVTMETSRGAAYQLLSYGAGDSYSPHVDCASSLTYGPPTEVEARRYYDDHTTGKRRQRAATVLLYLESTADGDAGGYTCFPRRSLCVRPRRGAAVLFQSLDAVYRCDHGSEHLSTAMVGDNARKVVLQRWYYNLHLTKLLHGGGRDVVFCDRLRNCRHYFH